MNPDIKQRWMAALRSGEYVQGRGKLAPVLSDGTQTHCCLGVLCELAVKDGIITSNKSPSGESIYYGRHSAFGVLPDEVVDWAELELHHNSPHVLFGPLDINEDLTVINDVGCPFSHIADFIDRSL